MSRNETTPSRRIAPDRLRLVKANNNLQPLERTTTIEWNQKQDTASLVTHDPSIICRLLPHPHVEVERVMVKMSEPCDRRYRSFDDIEQAVDIANITDSSIVNIRVSLPVGLISVKTSPREMNTGAHAVSSHWWEELRKRH